MACFCETTGANREFCRINRKLLPIKMFYFTFLAGVGSLLPFIAVYMKQLGLTSDETGVIYGVMPFLSFVVRPLVGALADRWLKHKVVLIACTLLTAVLHLLIVFVPPRAAVASVVHVKPVFLHCESNGSALASCPLEDAASVERKAAESFPEFGEQVPPGCSVSLEKFAKTVSESKTGEDGLDHVDVDPGLDGHHGVGNDSEARDKKSSRLADHGSCSMACYLAEDSARPLHHDGPGSEASGVCFADHVQPFLARRCDGLRVDDQPLRFNLTNPRRLFGPGRKQPSQPDRFLNGCHQRRYALLDVGLSGRTYDTVICSGARTMMCVMLCKGAPPSELCDEASGAVSVDLTFGLLTVLYFFASAAFSPIFSLADAVIFDQLGSQPHKYGQQRLWGTLGLATFAITSTFVMNSTRDVNKDVNYDVTFYLFAGMCTLSALIATSLAVSSRVRCQSLVKNACRLLILPEVLAFLAVVMYLGMVSGAIEGFLFWYLADLGGGPILFGLCLVVNCGFEIPFFFFSGAIIKRLKPVACLYSSMFVLSLRLLAYSLLSNPWFVLLAEALHGVTFGIMWAAVANHANAISPVGLSASVQGLVGGMNFGIGKGVGSLVTGLLFSCIGARWTFRVLAATCLVLLAVYALLNTYVFTEHAAQGPSSQRSVGRQETDKTEDENENQREEFLDQKTTDCT